MNQTFKLALTGLLASSLALPLPLQAVSSQNSLPTQSTTLVMIADKDLKSPAKPATTEVAPTEEATTEEATPETATATTNEKSETVSPPTAVDSNSTPEESSPSTSEPEDIVGFNLQNTVKGQTSDKIPVTANPLMLLQALKTSFTNLLKQHGKPLQIDSQVEMLLSDEFQQEIGQLPPLTLKTEVDAQGQGQSELTIAKFHLAEEKDKSVIDWQGLTGQVKFSEAFDSLAMTFKVAELMLENKSDEVLMSMSPFILNGTLDADFLPTQIEFNLPLFKMAQGATDQVNVRDITLNYQVEKSESGLALNNGSFKIGHLGFTEKAASKLSLDGLEMSGRGKEQNNLVTYTLHTGINQMVVTEDTPQNSIDMSYTGDVEMRNIDAQAAKELQQTVRNMQKQVQAGGLSEQMMGIVLIGKLMEIAPKLMANSPELSFSPLSLKTKEGELQGGLTIGLDGKKATTIELDKLLMAVTAKANFTLSKALLKKLLAVSQAATEEEEKPRKRKAKEPTPEQQIQPLLDQKYLVAEGDNYKLEATFNTGKLVLNGKERPLPFLDSMMQKPAAPAKAESK